MQGERPPVPVKDRTALVASFLLDRGIEQSRVQEALERGQSGIKKTSNAHTSFPHKKDIFHSDSTTDAELSLKIYFTPLYEDIIGTENLQGHVSTVNSLLFRFSIFLFRTAKDSPS